jgi:hypothetical protein
MGPNLEPIKADEHPTDSFKSRQGAGVGGDGSRPCARRGCHEVGCIRKWPRVKLPSTTDVAASAGSARADEGTPNSAASSRAAQGGCTKDLEPGNLQCRRLCSSLFVACWSLAWLGEAEVWTADRYPNVLDRLFHLWASTKNEDVHYLSAWAITALPLENKDKWAKLNLNADQAIAEMAASKLSGTVNHSETRQTLAALLFNLYSNRFVNDWERHFKPIADLGPKTERLVGLLKAYFNSRASETRDASHSLRSKTQRKRDGE